MQKDHPWLKHYEVGVPHGIEAPAITLQDLLPMAAEKYPERTALVMAMAAAGRLFTFPISYRRLRRDVDRFAASLQGLGVQPGDRVALYLPNCPQFVIAYLARHPRRRHRRALQPALLGPRSRVPAQGLRRLRGRRPRPFLPADQRRAGEDRPGARRGHPHQGILPAAALDALYPDQGAQAAQVPPGPRTTSGSATCSAPGRRARCASSRRIPRCCSIPAAPPASPRGSSCRTATCWSTPSRTGSGPASATGWRSRWPPCRCSTASASPAACTWDCAPARPSCWCRNPTDTAGLVQTIERLRPTDLPGGADLPDRHRRPSRHRAPRPALGARLPLRRLARWRRPCSARSSSAPACARSKATA